MKSTSRQASYRPKAPKLTRSERADIAARNRLVVEHLEWARGIAASVARKLPTWFTEDDLMGPAEIGLIEAASRYDASKNDNFRAYAQMRVYGACIASIRRREYKERAHDSLDTSAPISVDTGGKSSSSSEVREIRIPAPGPLPDVIAQAAITRKQMWGRVNELPPPNARVLRAHYWAGMTLVEIAVRMEVSESWVCRLHREGLNMLRARCADLKDLAA